MREISRVTCEHCGASIPVNVYSRNHGDKCPYKGAPSGCKMCKDCGQFVPVTSFATVTVNTFDGRNATCNSCLGKRYYVPKQAATA